MAQLKSPKSFRGFGERAPGGSHYFTFLGQKFYPPIAFLTSQAYKWLPGNLMLGEGEVLGYG